MSDPQAFPDARQFFFDRFDLSDHAIESALGAAVERKVDFADLYFQFSCVETFSLEESIVKKANKNVAQGVGVRAVAGDKTGYAYSDEVTLDSLRVAARTAHAIARDGAEPGPIAMRARRPAHDLYALREAPVARALQDKIDLLNRIDIEARRVDPRIANVIASLGVVEKRILVVNSDGLSVADVQPLVRLSIACIAQEGGNRQQGSAGGGGRVEFAYLIDGDRAVGFARAAAAQAIRNLSAVDAPAGTMAVVLGPGWPGVLLHEAVGHGLEGDFNRKKTSAFTGMIGRQVASPLCTVVDDGTLPNRRGSVNCDDEGTPTQRTVLVEKGILKGYLQDRLNAKLMGMASTGNGRRESFCHMPLPRMTNTFMLSGETPPEEIVRAVSSGLYAAYFSGGQVDITNGKFVFSASEAYLIEGGKITAPVKGATLIGNGPDVLKRIAMVGTDSRLDDGIGTCGKDGQSVPVGVGMPTVRIDGLTVGGTRA